MAHAVGLYGDGTRRNLDILRTVRNLFAHSVVALNFQTPEVAQACDMLTSPALSGPFLKGGFKFDTARERYLSTGLAVSQSLVINSLGTLNAGEVDEMRPVPLR